MPWRTSSRFFRFLQDHALVNAAFGLTIAVIVLGTWIAYRATTRLAADRRLIVHSHEVIARLDNLLLTMADAETGQRGYLLTGRESYLAPYQAAVSRVDSVVVGLDTLVSDNPSQRQRVTELRGAVAAKLTELQQTIGLAREGDLARALVTVRSDSGRKLMDTVRGIVAGMEEEERGLLRQRALTAASSYRAVRWDTLLSGLLNLLLVGLAFRLAWRGIEGERQATQIIAEQKERLRTTLASIGDAVITTDEHGLVTGMNAVAESLTRWSVDQARGQHVVEVLRIIDRYTRQPVGHPALRALNEGVIVGLANSVLLVARDGTETPMDDSAAPIRCAEGLIVGAVVVFRDVTERQAARDRLREAHSRLRSAMAAGEIGTWELDVKTGHVRCDDHCAALLVESATGEMDFSLEDFITTIDGPGHRLMRDAITAASNDGAAFDLVVPRPGAAGRWIAVRGRVERDDAGHVVRVPAVIVDVTSQRQAEDRERHLMEELKAVAASLAEANRRKDEFLATLAHELRNPLAPMRNGLEIIRLSRDEATVDKARVIVTRQLEQMVHLVEDLLDVNRISSGKLELRIRDVDVGEVLRDAVETSRPLLQQMGHRLDLALPVAPVVVRADVTRMVQVFANLLNNAAKYSERGSCIAVSSVLEEDAISISVRDEGMGIPTAMLERVFDLFTQVDGAGERSQGGLGIGLTLVKTLVEMHGGTVEARSDGEGRGSEFLVRLPR